MVSVALFGGDAVYHFHKGQNCAVGVVHHLHLGEFASRALNVDVLEKSALAVARVWGVWGEDDNVALLYRVAFLVGGEGDVSFILIYDFKPI